ncbi:MAG: DUF4272 domain-containing protein [Christensenellales bacterium]
MKSTRDILYRALANIAVSQRSICEWPGHPKEERKEMAGKVIAWVEKDKNILEAMDEDEKSMIYKRVGNRDREIRQAHWCWESEECLLWAINIVDEIELPYYEKNTRDLFAEMDKYTKLEPIVHDPTALIDKYTKHDVVDLILSHAKLRTEEEIEAERDIAMIWFWRAIEGKSNIFKKKPFKKIIERTFQDPEITKAVDSMPVAPDGMDLLVGNGKRFNSLNNEDISYAAACAGWRQKALEWILNDETWEDTTADT